jgi:hypothetical protein
MSELRGGFNDGGGVTENKGMTVVVKVMAVTVERCA